jgi:hypothetical protein
MHRSQMALDFLATKVVASKFKQAHSERLGADGTKLTVNSPVLSVAVSSVLIPRCMEIMNSFRWLEMRQTRGDLPMASSKRTVVCQLNDQSIRIWIVALWLDCRTTSTLKCAVDNSSSG